MLRTGSSRIAGLGAALLLVGGGLLAGSAGAAAAVDISLDFTAAAPLTYDHATGGGAFDNRSVGRAKDIVESLEGSDFRCGDVVTFLTHVHAGSGCTRGPGFPRARGARARCAGLTCPRVPGSVRFCARPCTCVLRVRVHACDSSRRALFVRDYFTLASANGVRTVRIWRRFKL